MDMRRVLPLLLILIFTLGTVSSVKNGRGGPNFSRQNRRIALNEYLVPPPPPRPHFAGRTGRVVNPKPTEASGYFSRLMGWLNPFAANPSPSSPPPSNPSSKKFLYPPLSPPPLPPSGPPSGPPLVPPPFNPSSGYDSGPPVGPPLVLPPSGPNPAPHSGPPLGPPPGFQSGPSGSSPGYNYDPPPGPANFHIGPPSGPPPGPPLVPPLGPPTGSHPPIYTGPQPPSYDRPPFPNPNNPQGYPPAPSPKGKNCNPCNKVPWIPMQNSGNQGDTGYPPQLPSLPPFAGDAYLPPDNRNANQDLHGHSTGTSQEIRPPDFSYTPPVGHDGVSAPVGPLPNPHLYPGPMPPLFKAESFDNPLRNGGADAEGYIDSVPYPSLHSPQNDSLVDVFSTNQGPIDQHYGAGSVPVQSFGHSSGQDYGGQGLGDQSSSDSHLKNQDSQIHHLGPDPNLQQGFEPNSQAFGGALGQQGVSGIYDHPDISGVQGYQDFSTPNYHLDGSANDFGSSGLNQQTFFSSNGLDHRGYADDLSSSGSVAKNSHAIPQTTVAASPESRPIHYEQSPLVDLTKNGDSHPGDSLIGSDLFLGLDELEDITRATVRYDSNRDHSYRGQQSTESYSSVSAQSTVAPTRDTTYFWYPTDNAESEERFENFENLKQNQTNVSKDTDDRDASYDQPSAQPGFLWPLVSTTTTAKPKEESYLGTLLKSFDETTTKRTENLLKATEQTEFSAEPSLRQQGAKRNKQVQVIIPYTSQYTPIPFQQSHGSLERTQPRKVSYLSGHDKYATQESRSEIKVANPTGQSQNVGPGTGQADVHTTTVPTTTRQFVKSTTLNKANNSIDVHRLQKNIDNWTIQEYSTGTTSSTVLASSPRPYLLPSKKIPDEYLTTTEPGSDEHGENVKTYALAGFSFNDLEHEGSASNRVEGPHVQVIPVDVSKSGSKTSTISATKNATSVTEGTPWQRYSVSISPLNKERVYVVTPQTVPMTTATSSLESIKRTPTTKSSRKPTERNPKKTRGKLASFESIERAYQVLPQAVNNLAVASTGPESNPLWGIMEHEEFASLGQEHEGDDDNDFEVPILYAGHSKVSRAKR